jgi:hypothetical protein
MKLLFVVEWAEKLETRSFQCKELLSNYNGCICVDFICEKLPTESCRSHRRHLPSAPIRSESLTKQVLEGDFCVVYSGNSPF